MTRSWEKSRQTNAVPEHGINETKRIRGDTVWQLFLLGTQTDSLGMPVSHLPSDLMDRLPTSLDAGTILVCWLQPRPVQSGQGWQVLSAAEQERASRYIQTADRCRSVAARVLARGVLGRLTGFQAESLILHNDDNGRPHLVHPSTDIDFNFAHGGDLILFACVHGARVGADVEPLRAMADAEGILLRFANSWTRQRWLELPLHLRLHGFLAWWTRTEAVLKAIGSGLATPLDSVAVDPNPDCASQTVVVGNQRYQVTDVPLPNHRGAIAISEGVWSPILLDLGTLDIGTEQPQ